MNWQNFYRVIPPDSPVHVEMPPSPAETETGPIAPELLVQLRQLLVEPWPALCETMAINETKSFARQLDILAEQWHCGALATYARRLLHDAETYAVTDLEKHLGEFASLVEQLDKEEKSAANEHNGLAVPPSDMAGSASGP